jgi:DUF4097 and DUF4098 domain-containing protein YvlB
MNKSACVILLPFLLIASAIPTTAREIKKDFHESFDVKEGATLHLKHGDGDVTITPWDKDIVDVSVHYRAELKSVGIGGKHYFDVEFRQSDDAIHVIGKVRSSGSIGFRYFKRQEYTYTVRAPRYLELDLEGEDGDVDIRNWQGKIFSRLDDGDIRLQDILSPKTQIRLEDGDLDVDGLQGDLSVHAEDGDIVLRECKSQLCRIKLEDGDIRVRLSEGDFEISIEDGDVTLDQVRAGLLDIRAGGGDIELDLLKTEGIDLDISAEDGDVTVDLEPGISATVSIDTDEGRIRTNLPDRISTSDGNVVLRESD